MKLHTVFITYNRLELTKRVIESYLQTVTLPYSFTVVDNGSTDGTEEWLEETFDLGGLDEVVLLRQNYYPGYACNRGWELAPDDTTLFHRSDNDHVFLPGWCEQVEHVFQTPKIGQLGLRTAEEERYEKGNVGGNCIIRSELWWKGLRWDERPWPQLTVEVGPGHTEDSLFSPAVRKLGYTWTRVRRPCIVPISPEVTDDPYYIQSWRDRGIHI